MIALVFAAVSLSSDLDGYRRLVGGYHGPMDFFDESEKKNRRFEIDLEIKLDPAVQGSIWNWKYNFNPPQFSEEFGIYEALADGITWQEKSAPGKGFNNFQFVLTRWQQFCAGQSDWFEIQMLRKKGMIGGDNALFKRRYTLHSDRLISEKWLKYPGKDWFLDHRMNLKKLRSQGFLRSIR